MALIGKCKVCGVMQPTTKMYLVDKGDPTTSTEFLCWKHRYWEIFETEAQSRYEEEHLLAELYPDGPEGSR